MFTRFIDKASQRATLSEGVYFSGLRDISVFQSANNLNTQDFGEVPFILIKPLDYFYN